MAVPHAAVLGGGPDIFLHAGILLLVSGDPGLQLTDLIAGNEARAALVGLADALYIPGDVPHAGATDKAVHDGAFQLGCQVLGDGGNQVEILTDPLFQDLLVKLAAVVVLHDIDTERFLDCLKPLTVDRLFGKQAGFTQQVGDAVDAQDFAGDGVIDLLHNPFELVRKIRKAVGAGLLVSFLLDEAGDLRQALLHFLLHFAGQIHKRLRILPLSRDGILRDVL